VVGLVTDFQGAEASGTNNFSGITQSLSARLDFLGPVRARTGLAVNNWLFYGSGGLAYGDAHSIINYNDPILTGATVSGSQSETRLGRAAGGGVNYTVTRTGSAVLTTFAAISATPTSSGFDRAPRQHHTWRESHSVPERRR
jgi:opacity protein-like surface antigen